MNMIRPTSRAWNRDCRKEGRVAYFVIDGGIKNPVDGTMREAKVLQLNFP